MAAPAGIATHSVSDTPASASADAGFSCVHCYSTRATPFLTGCRDYYMGHAGAFDYLTCQTCGLTQLFPIPADIGRFYDSYQVHAKKSRLHDVMRRHLMGRGYYYPAASMHVRVLDYGCGDGWYLSDIVARGHDAVGFETNAEHAKQLSRATGRAVYSDPDQLCAEQAGGFDVVTLHFVLEHLSDIDGAFTRVHKLLRPGGIFYFMVPNIRSMEARLFRRKWHGLDPPRHLIFPTPEIIGPVCARTGFETVKLDCFSLPNGFAGSMSAALTGRFSYPLFAALMPAAVLFAALCSDGNLAFTLRKPQQQTRS